MDLTARLLEEHADLRSCLRSIEAALDELERGDCRSPETLSRFADMVRLFLAAFKAHEKLEDRFFPAALGGDEELMRVVEADHAGVDQVFELLNGLVACGQLDDVYAARFAVARIARDLERHLAFEETVVFPRLKQAARAPAPASGPGSPSPPGRPP